MSGLLTGIGIETLTEDTINVYNIPNITIGLTDEVHSTVGLFYNDESVGHLFSPYIGPSSTYYATHVGLAADTTYYVKMWVQDSLGNRTSEAARWITTVPAGSYEASGNAYNSCGDPQEANVPRHSWKSSSGYGGGAKSPTVKGGEVA